MRFHPGALLRPNSLFSLVLGFPNSLGYSAEKDKTDPCELTQTIRAMHNALAPGGRVFWRSSAMSPWYQELYRREGFKVECIHARPIGGMVPIDRVNM